MVKGVVITSIARSRRRAGLALVMTFCAFVSAAGVRYVSPGGGGDGLTPETPSTFAEAVAAIGAEKSARGWSEAKTIALLDGRYRDLYVDRSFRGKGSLTALDGDYVIIRSYGGVATNCVIAPPDGVHAVFGGSFNSCNLRFASLMVYGSGVKYTNGFFAASVKGPGSRGEIRDCFFNWVEADRFVDISGSVDWLSFAVTGCIFNHCTFDRNLTGINRHLNPISKSFFDGVILCTNSVDDVAFNRMDFEDVVFAGCWAGYSAAPFFYDCNLTRCTVERCQTGWTLKGAAPMFFAFEGRKYNRGILRDTVIADCYVSPPTKYSLRHPLFGSGDDADRGGILALYGCTVVGNDFPLFHNADDCDYGLFVANSIVVGNRFRMVATSPTDLGELTFNSFFQEELGSVEALGATCRQRVKVADVGFADYLWADYRLQRDSTARDFGSVEFVEPGERDRRGGERVLGAAPDAGAYEFRPAGTALELW